MSIPGEIRQLLAELSTISHVSGVSYDAKTSRDTTESIGGRRPSGGDREPRPRRPSLPLHADDPTSVKEWDDYDDERQAWGACFERRNVDYFRAQLKHHCSEERLRAIRDEIRMALEAWRRMRIPPGQPPALGDPQWKRWIAESSLTVEDVVRMYGVSRQYVHRVRRQYRDSRPQIG